MSKIRFELNRKGVSELMKSPEMQSALSEYGAAVAKRAGEGYEATTAVGKTRANVKISAATAHAWFSNLKHNTLLKALK